jgi:ATP-dependent DNA helicase RecG
MFKYIKLYSGQEPTFREGDVFRIIVPLNDAYSYGFGNINQKSAENDEKVPINDEKVPINNGKVLINDGKVPINDGKVPINEKNHYKKQRTEILEYIVANGKITTKEAAALLQVKQRRARDILCELVNRGVLKKEGVYKSTVYVMDKEEKM